MNELIRSIAARDMSAIDFKKLQKERLNKAGGDTKLSQKRGTSTLKATDIPDVPLPSLKGQKITTKRGTSTSVL